MWNILSIFLLLATLTSQSIVEGQRLFTQGPLKQRSYEWKVPGRPISISIRPHSTVGNLERGQESGKRIKGEDELVPYVVGLPGDINMLRLPVMSNDIDGPDPPPHQQVAKMARFIVSQSNWTSIATISNRGSTTGAPFSSILSVSDGTLGISTGVPYLYMTPIDDSAKNLKVNPNASMVMSLVQSGYCETRDLDPEDPRCALVSLNGRIVQLPVGSDEEKFGKTALFFKHPVMRTWPKSHHWFVAKLNITNILVRDYFGGAYDVDVGDYFAANLDDF